MKISEPVRIIIDRAYNEAKQRSHEYLTPEHILYAALEFDEIQEILHACGANLDNLKHGIETYFEQKVPIIAGADPIQSFYFQSVIERAVMTCQAAQKKTLDASDILVSLFDEEKNYCAYYLRLAGVKRYDLLNVISHGIENGQSYSYGNRPRPHTEADETKDGTPDEDTYEGGAKTR